MEIKSTPVSKCLDKKLQMLGYEIPDVLAVFFVLTILNFLFGQTEMKLLLIWMPTFALAGFLRVMKNGKPDDYLLHLIRFHLRPKYLSAFPEPTQSLKRSTGQSI